MVNLNLKNNHELGIIYRGYIYHASISIDLYWSNS
jgi:hypothetical protein